MTILRKILLPLFYLTTAYSFVALLSFSNKTGGPCNAGIAIIFIGFFLIICSLLVFFAIKYIIRLQRTTKGNKRARIFTIIALLIWGFWLVAFFGDDMKESIMYITPFLITIILTVIMAFSKSKNKWYP